MEVKIMSTKPADILRSELSALGINGRQVTVRTRTTGSLDVTIRDPKVSFETVEKAAYRHQSVSRCEVTGEILSGGNRFVQVRYSSEAAEVIGAPFVDAVRKAVEGFKVSIKTDRNVCVPVEGAAGAYVVESGLGAVIRFWNKHSDRRSPDVYVSLSDGANHAEQAFHVARFAAAESAAFDAGLAAVMAVAVAEAVREGLAV